ncbi:MAG: PEP-CTERM sorting domain-containing protein [Bryobacterales bacterium]|nr:PEP-CTERM sorting domain-containing protein [Bryobacterales bacterium]
MTWFRSILCGLIPATLALCAPITPVSYTMLNGQGVANGGILNYWDESYSGSGSTTTDGALLSGGLGQLTDGFIGCSNDWTVDCGDGAAFRWVAWNTIDPVIVFDFGSLQQFQRISVHTNNVGVGGVSMWDTALFQFSNDGVNFSPGVLRTTSAAEKADPNARYLDTNLAESGRYVRISFADGPTNIWVLLSEIQFDGVADVPEPGTALLAAAGLLVLMLRRRG